MSILISGITGFVGENLKKYLIKQGYSNVRGLDLRLKWKQEIDSSVETIIHLAGKAHDLKKVSDPDEYYKINLHLTAALYDEFLVSKVKTFIFISSIKAAADSVNDIIDEKFVPQPTTHYGKSKLLAEQYIQSKPLPEGKKFIILRPCMIHGPGNKGNLNLLFQLVKRGFPYPLAIYKNRRSYLSVQNFCFIIDQLLQKNQVRSGVYHLADDQSLSTTEVFRILSRSLNKEPILLNVPVKIIKFIAFLGDQLRLPLNTERLDKLTGNFEVSNWKIKTEISSELPLSAAEGVLITANSFH